MLILHKKMENKYNFTWKKMGGNHNPLSDLLTLRGRIIKITIKYSLTHQDACFLQCTKAKPVKKKGARAVLNVFFLIYSS